MRTTIPTEPGSPAGCGLGLFRLPMSCGVVARGHGGDIPGCSTFSAVTDDGRAVTFTVTSLNGSVTDKTVGAQRSALLDAALCAK